MVDTRTIPNLSEDLRLPALLVVAALMASGVVVTFVGFSVPAVPQVSDLGVLIIVLAGACWGITAWKEPFGRWCLIAGLVGLVLVADVWLGVPGSLALLALPTVLAVALVGPGGAAGVAAVESALVILLPHATGAEVVSAILGWTLSAIWISLALQWAIHQRIRHQARWLHEYSRRSQTLIEEARDRRAQLEQAMDEMVRLNRQLKLLGERSAMLRAIAEDAEKARTTFVANVSHELRTPLNMITGLIGLIMEHPDVYIEPLPPKLLDDLRVVQRNSEHLLSMINDVLDLSQRQAGFLRLYREWVDLREILTAAVVAVRPMARKKGLRLEIALPPDLPKVYCDRTRIRQVVLNLLSNATRFTDRGSVALQIERDEDRVLVAVSDTGPGIAPDVAERIFEPFCQGETDLWRDKGGTGLGLSISREFVELHGGRIWLESYLGEGTVFFFELPIAPPGGRATSPAGQIKEDWIWREGAFRTERSAGGLAQAARRVVVVDETGTLPSLKRATEQAEFIVCQDPAGAGKDLEEIPAHAVLIHAASPEQLMALVQDARSQIPDTPVIGCSLVRPAFQEQRSDYAAYLTKPVTRADLVRALKAVGRTVRNILIVEDDPEFRDLLVRMLRTCDGLLKVDLASTGAQALDALRHRPPDLVMLDIMLPDIDGWEVLARKREDEALSHIPVVMVSAQDREVYPMTSEVLVASLGNGFTMNQVVSCVLALSDALLKPN